MHVFNIFSPPQNLHLCMTCLWRSRFTFSGHLSQQLVCELLREEHSLSEAQGAIRTLHTETLQVLAHMGQTQVGQSRWRRLILETKREICCCGCIHSNLFICYFYVMRRSD